MSFKWMTLEQEECLSEMSAQEQRKEVKQFLVDMMDLTEQTEKEGLYIKLYEALKD